MAGPWFREVQSLGTFYPHSVGCDTVSSFAGRGKKMVWEIWKTFNEVTSALCTLASTPSSVDDQLKLLERFVILLYGRTRTEENVNDARKQMFSQEWQTNG